MNLIQENIDNLTSLWQLAGNRCGVFEQNSSYSFSYISQSSWPNRIWLTANIDSTTFNEAITKAKQHGLGISLWDELMEMHQLEAEGYKLKLELQGMSMPLEEWERQGQPIELLTVGDDLTAAMWSDLFRQAFGYRIDSTTVLKTMDRVQYFIARAHGRPVGTAVLFHHKPEIAGIHSMGIIPDMRGQGYAKRLLHSVLGIGKASGAQWAILQASSMGEGLYLKTGFTQQFTLKTYKYNI
ncbi:MAG: GNAT family N-acetyltransferase [Roseivirga sp.]|jgi:GNAT superfamily N-acetyltransferase|uniref:GNAT family N-acetyltransferase n=1 Tax=Roseivirga sp. TaxID=1964215 RepID=UPI001B26E863|nr:GNAT family N-acetyltransferase [Roseivirga sp.]MBO6495772.1 GNAT family N-acetyltransferase [Roseivirga sp.]